MKSSQGFESAAAEEAAAVAASIDVPDLAGRLGTRVVSLVSELRECGDDDLHQMTLATATQNVQQLLNGFQANEPPFAVRANDVTLSWVSAMAQRGISSAAMLRCYLIGQGMCDLALGEAAARLVLPERLSDDIKWQLVQAGSQYVLGYVETITGELIEHYQNERERWVQGPDSARAEFVRAIIEGRSFDPDAARATLRYHLDRPHVAVVVWVDARSRQSPPSQVLKRAVAKVAHQLGGTDLLVVPAGPSVMWGWTAGPHVTDSPPGRISVETPLMASVGGLGCGLDGFILSHRQACDGRRTAGVFARPAGTVVCFRDIVLPALLTRDLSAAGQFVKAELGELGSDSERSQRLRATLIAFFEEGMSWAKTAERLCVHQNTVIYRVQQAKDLLGRSLTDRRLELEVALRLAEARSRPAAPGIDT